MLTGSRRADLPGVRHPTSVPPVTVLAPAYWPTIGGGQSMARELAHRVRGPFRVSVLRLHGDGATSRATPWELCAQPASEAMSDLGVPVVSVGSRGPMQRALTGLAAVCPRLRVARPFYELLLFHDLRHRLLPHVQETRLLHVYGNGFPSVILVASQLAQARRIPLVITPFWHLRRPAFPLGRLSPRSLILPPVCRSADAVVAMTALERQWLIDHGVRPERCHVIPGGPVIGRAADPEGFRRRQGLGTAPMVLFLGRHWRPKGYRRLAVAAPLVWRHFPDARFVFIGPHSDESIAFFRHCRDTAGRLILLGQVSLEDKTSALAACDLLCVPSASESLGLVYLEAWAMGKPVIAERIPVLETVIDDGVDGVLVDHDRTSVAAAICRLLGDPRQAKSMGAAGAAKVKQRYRWSTAADRLSRLYVELIHRQTSMR
jgi:glycosyltransferase involved in cell wall biosynthesis